MSEKVWIIYDERAWTEEPEEASVYESFCSSEGDTLKKVIKTRNKDWPGGVVFSYDVDSDGKTLINQFMEG